MSKRGVSVILFMSLLSGGLCNSVKRNYVRKNHERFGQSIGLASGRRNFRDRRSSDYGYERNSRYSEESRVSNYGKFRSEKLVNRPMKIWPLVTIGLGGFVIIGGVVYFVSSDGELTKVDTGMQTPITPKNVQGYKPQPSSWGNLVSRKLGNLTVRAYNGNITQIGRDEDTFKISGLDDSKCTCIVSPDNSSFNPGVLAGVISCAQNNKSGGGNQYLDKENLSQKCNANGWSDKIPSGCALLGDAGGYLGVNNIIHGVAPNHSKCSKDKKCDCEQKLIDVYYNSICEAVKANLRRVVFPPMGDDNYENPTELTALCFMSAIAKLCSENKLGNIEYIDVVIHSNHNKPKNAKNNETKLDIFKEKIEGT